MSIYSAADEDIKAVSLSSSSVFQNPFPSGVELQQLLVSEKNHDDGAFLWSRIPPQTECDFSSVDGTLPPSLPDISTS